MGNCESFCGGNGQKKPFREQNYDFLVKKDIQKDGLDVYQPKESIYSSTQIKCPLCKYDLPEEEYLIINNKLSLVNETKLLDLQNNFNFEVESPDKIDNINELEIIYEQIINCIKSIEDNRYYKHICTNNELNQEIENQEIYIDLCSLSNLDNIKNNLSVDIERLKTDENYKNNYLRNKEEKYNNYIKKERKRQIENKYRPEFEKKTSEKEQYEYEITTMFIKQVYEGEMARINSINNNNPVIPGMLPYDPYISKPNPSGFYYGHETKFRYSGSKKN